MWVIAQTRVIGNNMTRDGGTNHSTQDVRKCESTHSGRPAYWGVTYSFRGQPHQVQMATAPEATLCVNGKGEPRQQQRYPGPLEGSGITCSSTSCRMPSIGSRTFRTPAALAVTRMS